MWLLVFSPLYQRTWPTGPDNTWGEGGCFFVLYFGMCIAPLMTTTTRYTLSAGFGRVLWVGLLNGVGLHAHLPSWFTKRCGITCPSTELTCVPVYWGLQHANKHTHAFTLGTYGRIRANAIANTPEKMESFLVIRNLVWGLTVFLSAWKREVPEWGSCFS